MVDYVRQCGIVIPQDVREKISLRYHAITKAVNQTFWDSNSDVANSFYGGSYGRGTAISTSDIDLLVVLPEMYFDRYTRLTGNGPSRLLQAVKQSIMNVYSTSEVRADGQVVKILFKDGRRFEVVPVKNSSNRFFYPDTNNGGSWKSTNPKVEQNAMREINSKSNGLLFDTCKHIRKIRDEKYSSYHLSGIVIDSFVYDAIGTWRWSSERQVGAPAGAYEESLLRYFMASPIARGEFISAPGSGDLVETSSSFECLRKVLTYMTEW